MQQDIEARVLGLLNEQRRAMGEEAQAQTASLNAQIAELRGVAQAQDTGGRSLLQQLENARRGIAERDATIARGTQALAEQDARLVELSTQLQATQLAQQAEANARVLAERTLAEMRAAMAAGSTGSVAAGATHSDREAMNMGLRDFAYRQGTVKAPEMFSGKREE